ncbi:sialate O-acetylesterase [Coprobacter sp.]
MNTHTFNLKARIFIAILGVVFTCGSAAEEKSKISDVKTYEHFIIYGQSLSTGHQSYPALTIESLAGNYMIGDQVWINQGNRNSTSFNPLKSSLALTEKRSPLSRNGGIAECPVVAAVNHLRLKINNSSVGYIATSTGVGGKTIDQLSKHCRNKNIYQEGFLKAAFAAPQITAKEGVSVTCPLVIWMQGEYNYWADTTRGLLPHIPNVTGKNEYKALMLKLKEDMQNDVVSVYNQQHRPLFITYQVGAQYTRGKTLNIGMAQLEAANETEDIICAGPVYPMTDRGGHLDANGYRWYGEMLAKAYYRTMVEGKPFIPLQPEELSRTSDFKEIKIRFRVPKMPLVLDDYTTEKIKDYGFAVYNDDVRQDITGVRIKGNCVYITCEKDLSGTVEVTYAGTNEFKGHGNLRDSDDYEAFYTYIDQDKKNSDGSFVFARDKDKDGNYVTLRPNYEPRDKSGNIIYECPYPLYNFSVAFYYKLDKGMKKYLIRIPEKSMSGLTKMLRTNH